jgi:hypothetical protein
VPDSAIRYSRTMSSCESYLRKSPKFVYSVYDLDKTSLRLCRRGTRKQGDYAKALLRNSMLDVTSGASICSPSSALLQTKMITHEYTVYEKNVDCIAKSIGACDIHIVEFGSRWRNLRVNL